MSEETTLTTPVVMPVPVQASIFSTKSTMRATPHPRSQFVKTAIKREDAPKIDQLIDRVSNYETLTALAHALESESPLEGEDESSALWRKEVLNRQVTINSLVHGVLEKEDLTPIKLIEKYAGVLETLVIDTIDETLTKENSTRQINLEESLISNEEKHEDHRRKLRSLALKKAFPDERSFGDGMEALDISTEIKDAYRLFSCIQDIFRKEIITKVNLYLDDKESKQVISSKSSVEVTTPGNFPGVSTSIPDSATDTIKTVDEMVNPVHMGDIDTKPAVKTFYETTPRGPSESIIKNEENLPIAQTVAIPDEIATSTMMPPTQETVVTGAKDEAVNTASALQPVEMAILPEQTKEQIAIKAFKVIAGIVKRTQERLKGIQEKSLESDPKKLLLKKLAGMQFALEEIEPIKRIQLHYVTLSAAIHASAQSIVLILGTILVQTPETLRALLWREASGTLEIKGEASKQRGTEVSQTAFIHSVALSVLISIYTPKKNNEDALTTLDSDFENDNEPFSDEPQTNSFPSPQQEDFIVAPTQKGGIIWKTLERIVATELVPGSVLATNEEARALFIETVLDNIRHDPSYFGISSGDINKIQAGENLDKEKIIDLVSRLIRMAGLTATVSMSNPITPASISIEEQTPITIPETIDNKTLAETSLSNEIPEILPNGIDSSFIKNQSIVREVFLNTHFIDMVILIRKLKDPSQLVPLEKFCIENASCKISEVKNALLTLKDEQIETRDELLALFTYAESIYFRNLRKDVEQAPSLFEKKSLVEVILTIQNGAVKTFGNKTYD